MRSKSLQRHLKSQKVSVFLLKKIFVKTAGRTLFKSATGFVSICSIAENTMALYVRVF